MKPLNLKLSIRTLLLSATVGLLATSCSDDNAESSTTIRVGHFPNITHAHALVARNMARHGNDWFAKYLPGYQLEWYIYNAGPSAMEAVFGRSIDLTYVGPSPAINAYSRSNGTEVRILSGAVDGASALVVQPDKNLKAPIDFLGTIISTPQLGNTQDVSCRAWLKNAGFNVSIGGALGTDAMRKEKNFTTPSNGVDVAFMPMANAEILSMFKRKQIDAAWTVEPWVTRLEKEAGGKVLIEENTAITTVLAGRVKWMDQHPELVSKFVQAHHDLSKWITEHPEEAQKMAAEELSELTQTKVSPELIATAWKRMIITNDISREGLEDFVKSAQESGLIGNVPSLDRFIAPPKN